MRVRAPTMVQVMDPGIVGIGTYMIFAPGFGFNLETAVGSQQSAHAQGACPRLDGSSAGALDLARSSDPFR